MDDQVPVRMRNSVAHQQKEAQLGAQIERRGVLIDSGSVHVLHDQIGPPILGMAGIQQACDGRVVQRRKQLALFQETFAPRRPVRIGAKEFDRHPLFDLAVTPFGQIDGAHATGADRPDQPVRAAAAGHGSGAPTLHLLRRAGNAPG